METCFICSSSELELRRVKDQSQIDAAKFLKHSSTESDNIVRICSACLIKVQMIAGLKQECNNKESQVKNDLEISENSEEEEVILEEELEEDVDLEELDLLSSYYAEQELETDPDFLPNQKSKKVRPKSSQANLANVKVILR